MKTYFFTQLKQLNLKNAVLNINFLENDQVTVIFQMKPKSKDQAIQNIKPLTLTGSNAEMNERFLDLIQKPIQKITTLSESAIAYDKEVEKARLETKMAKDKKAKAKLKTDKANNKVKEADAIINTDGFDFADSTKVNSAKKLINEALKIDAENQKAKDLLAKITSNTAQASMF